MTYLFFKRDIKILKTFIREAEKNLNVLERNIINLEKNYSDIKLLDSSFRNIHNIKCGASFFDISCITQISYIFEFAFVNLQSEKITLNNSLINHIYKGIELLKNIIQQISEKLKEEKADIADSMDNFQLQLNDEKEVIKVVKDIEKFLPNKKDIFSLEEKVNCNVEKSVLEKLNSDKLKNNISEEFEKQFMAETLEHVEDIENNYLVKLDKNCEDKEAMNGIFKAIHNIKGGASIIISTLDSTSSRTTILKSIFEVTNLFETLIVIFRDNALRFSRDNIDLCYDIVDYIRFCISLLENNEIKELMDQPLLKKIKELIENSNKVSKENNKDKSITKSKDSSMVTSIVQSIRVNQDKIDKLMNMIAELIITKNSFWHISKNITTNHNLIEVSKEIKEVGSALNRISDELQNTVMSIRMVEIKTVFQKMPRIVRDIAQAGNKKINIVIEGENTEIDKTIVEQISDPLIHIIRNSADHGIEEPEERLMRSKNEIGTIKLRAYNRNKNVIIEIEDDGKGIDSEEIKKKAIEKNLITISEAETLSKNSILNLIFIPGFSTAKKVTEVSGRGVGMDVVKSNITKLRGTVSIESEVNKGTKITIKLPLTLAISRGLLVETGRESYIIPIESIVETVKIPSKDIHKVKDKFITHLRGEVIGVEWLSRILQQNVNISENEELSAVVIRNGTEKNAIIVDKLKSEQEIVVKPLSDYLSAITGIAGSTVLGNGKVVLILNVPDLIKIIA